MISSEFDKYDEPRIHIETLMREKLVKFDMLSLRILLRLESAGIKTLGDLLKCRREYLLSIPQFGVTSLRKIEDFLDRLGFNLPK